MMANASHAKQWLAAHLCEAGHLLSSRLTKALTLLSIEAAASRMMFQAVTCCASAFNSGHVNCADQAKLSKYALTRTWECSECVWAFAVPAYF